MNIYELIKKRRSVRAYKDEPVPEESLRKILEAGRLAPSAHNAQDYKFIVVKDKKTIKELASDRFSRGQRFFVNAPIVIAAISLKPNYLMSSGVLAYPMDIGIAIDHMTLAAAEEGLGTCWIGAFSQEEVKRILNVPNKYKIAALLPLGFPDDKSGPKVRKNIKELICFEKFNE